MLKKEEIISIQAGWFLMLDVFVCSVCAAGWHRRRPEGNISLIYWSLFSLSSIAAVGCPGYGGTIWLRRWGWSWAWPQPPH